MKSENNLRMQLKEALDNLWARIKSLVSGLDTRVTALEQGGGGGGQANVIEAISFNGTNVPPDASKRVSLQETDPTVPSWAKASSKPTYTASEVGALADTTTFVSGVKGAAEATYRSGQVELSPANLGAVAKSGDTMTGNLGVRATWPGVSLYANGGTQETGALTSHRDNGRVYITEHSTDGTNEEYYQLPIADGNGTYNILTTKVPVSSSQGGTGGPYFFTCSGKTGLTVKSSNGWGGFAVLSITASSAHLTAIGFNGSNAPNAVNIYGGDPGLNPQLSSSNTITCTLRRDRHYIIIGTDKVSSISAS